MQIFYPCKKCIIKAICQIKCIEEKDYQEIRYSIANIVAAIIYIISIFIIIMVISYTIVVLSFPK